MMKSFGYYSSVDIDVEKGIINMCDYRRDDVALYVNCAGAICRRAGFTTRNMRGRNDYYLMYIIEGNLRIRDDGGMTNASGGTVVLFAPKYKYEYVFPGDEGLLYYWVHFTGSEVERLLERLGLTGSPLICNVGHSEQLIDDFDRLFTSYVRADGFRDIENSYTLGNILTCVARLCSRRADGERLRRSLSYIHANYAGRITVEQLAQLENLSVSRFNALFREAVGKPPMKYIIDLRLQNACSLLSITDMPVGRIGEHVGFSDVHFFSKLFKKHIGMTPSEYRCGCNKGTEHV